MKCAFPALAVTRITFSLSVMIEEQVQNLILVPKLNPVMPVGYVAFFHIVRFSAAYQDGKIFSGLVSDCFISLNLVQVRKHLPALLISSSPKQSSAHLSGTLPHSRNSNQLPKPLLEFLCFWLDFWAQLLIRHIMHQNCICSPKCCKQSGGEKVTVSPG